MLAVLFAGEVPRPDAAAARSSAPRTRTPISGSDRLVRFFTTLSFL
jgi:hypothetical protein